MPPPTPKAAVPAPNANAPAAATKDDKDRKEAKDAALPTTFVDWAAVEPLLQDRCSSCHEPNDKKGGLDVTTFAAMRAGGGSGKTITPGEPEQSRLYLMVTMQERPFMPKGEDPLPAEQQQLLRTWIEQGPARRWRRRVRSSAADSPQPVPRRARTSRQPPLARCRTSCPRWRWHGPSAPER